MEMKLTIERKLKMETRKESEMQTNTTATPQIRKQYLSIKNEAHRILRQKQDLIEELERLNVKVGQLWHQHFECVRHEVSKLIDEAPAGDQVLIEVSLLKETLDYMSEQAPYGDDLPF
jgi:predicted nuclease with TOPRIM domain